eukprot:1153536-Pelagomonas_calceolata.AAC.7
MGLEELGPGVNTPTLRMPSILEGDTGGVCWWGAHTGQVVGIEGGTSVCLSTLLHSACDDHVRTTMAFAFRALPYHKCYTAPQLAQSCGPGQCIKQKTNGVKQWSD